ncbi:hypothetical protein [Kordia sp.]|uniref:hypothetical protein n=1 Tax=Kordia sp. TaxID=1965332 RepID=UPI003B5C7DC3
MPIHPPRNSPTRKVGIFEYKVFEFLRCLQDNCSEEKLTAKAENVKTAMLKLLKARLATMKSYSTEDESKEQQELRIKINNQIVQWRSISYAEIEQYCLKNYTS